MPNQARMKSRGGLATAALVLVIMSSQLQTTWADLVIINAQKDSGADQLKVCAMRRDLASPGKDGKTFPLVYLNRTDGACHELDPVSAHSITDRATFLWIRGQPQCSLAQIASNVEPNDPAMVIIGTNGPLVYIYIIYSFLHFMTKILIFFVSEITSCTFIETYSVVVRTLKT